MPSLAAEQRITLPLRLVGSLTTGPPGSTRNQRRLGGAGDAAVVDALAAFRLRAAKRIELG